ncbi:hypothetical protein [Psychromicrobium lacuslunae]|uniref:Multidrug ABC transporter ATPase n=1 Tax=Psychromicrobium lacuslunae TaxID=1618207 RepID=A0A0D4C2N4_9MICC|nr:hypothetical protein [Psychromicrobium lacuslunae]AJT42645.1 hypothetical protein UM93_16315 [Psychromicrobium lacuslunae]
MMQSRPNSAEPWWRLVNFLALLLAVLGIGTLAYLVLVRLSGGQTWSGLNWLPMTSLPLAFILLAISILHAVRRRRQL